MWAPMSVALLIGVLSQATSGSVGLAIGYGVVLVAVIGIALARRRSVADAAVTARHGQ